MESNSSEKIPSSLQPHHHHGHHHHHHHHHHFFYISPHCPHHRSIAEPKNHSPSCSFSTSHTEPLSSVPTEPFSSFQDAQSHEAIDGSEMVQDEIEKLEAEEEEEPIFVLTDEWRDFFAKSEAKRKLAKKQARKQKT